MYQEEQDLCLERMQKFEQRMSSVIDRSKMILKEKVSKIEHKNKVTEGKV
jgi:hypothetical protein